MDRTLKVETLAFVLMIVAFPVISIGSHHASKVTWVIGLLCLVFGGLLPILTRYVPHAADDAHTDMGMDLDDRTS